MTTLTVWFDDGCPLCRREIALMRRLAPPGAIRFVAVDDGLADCPVDRAALLARFHALEDGRMLSGAAAFAAMWRGDPPAAAARPRGAQPADPLRAGAALHRVPSPASETAALGRAPRRAPGRRVSGAEADSTIPVFVATRAEALRRLDLFLPRAGRAYAEGRNSDGGPGAERSVSALSPYLRYRLLTEREVIAAVLDRHGPQTADKFVSEVLWRTYFKGWLELRPAAWTRFLAARDAGRDAMARSGGLARAVAAAEEGRTGIEGFDDWARELVDHGYLHNHTRMWFASIWIFTLRLPWALGADFFLRHLVDADPASNTLSWRWVAGLQTPGKTYLATADNIARYTSGRFPSARAGERGARAHRGSAARRPRAADTRAAPGRAGAPADAPRGSRSGKPRAGRDGDRRRARGDRGLGGLALGRCGAALRRCGRRRCRGTGAGALRRRRRRARRDGSRGRRGGGAGLGGRAASLRLLRRSGLWRMR